MLHFRSFPIALTFVSLSASATFEFTDSPANDSYYIDMGSWNGLDNMSSAPLTLPIRSCFFFCIGRAEYFLRAYDFGFAHEDLSIDSNLALARISFSEAGSADSIDIRDSRAYPTNSISPSATEVNGQLILHVLGDELDSAKPGKYRARVTLEGYNNPFWDGRQEDTRYLNVDLEVPDRVKISGLSNVPLNSSSPGSEITSLPMNFCVFSQGGSEFQMKAQGDNDTSAFVLAQGGSTIDYELLVDHPDYSSLPVNSYTGPWTGSKSQGCDEESGSNMSLRVHVPGGQNANSGIYSDIVTLTVMPI